jgi:hypothetical protein
VIVGGRDFHDIRTDEIQAGQTAEDALDFARSPSSRFRRASYLRVSV